MVLHKIVESRGLRILGKLNGKFFVGTAAFGRPAGEASLFAAPALAGCGKT
jgi:hypothetical protein